MAVGRPEEEQHCSSREPSPRPTGQGKGWKVSDSEPCPGRTSARKGGQGDCSRPGPLGPTQLELGRWRERVPGHYAAWARNPMERVGVGPAGGKSTTRGRCRSFLAELLLWSGLSYWVAHRSLCPGLESWGLIYCCIILS